MKGVVYCLLYVNSQSLNSPLECLQDKLSFEGKSPLRDVWSKSIIKKSKV